eukprot:scaffold981_cov119-Cylindrotheca_fusiformis.AAC.6
MPGRAPGVTFPETIKTVIVDDLCLPLRPCVYSAMGYRWESCRSLVEGTLLSLFAHGRVRT